MQMLLSIFALTSSATPSVIRCQLQRFVYKQFTNFKVDEFTDLEICNVLPVSELCKTPFFWTMVSDRDAYWKIAGDEMGS